MLLHVYGCPRRAQHAVVGLLVGLCCAPVMADNPDTQSDAAEQLAAKEIRAALVKELESVRAVESITDANMLRWATYCGSVQEGASQLRDSLSQDGTLTRKARRRARRKGKDMKTLQASLRALLLASDITKEIEAECARLEPAYTSAVKARNTTVARQVASWVSRSPLEEEDLGAYWTEWQELDEYLRDAVKKSAPDRGTALSSKKRLDAAWQSAHREIRTYAAKQLYVLMLRGMVSVDRVRATGTNGSVLEVRRTQCGGSFTSILMSRFAQLVDLGQFAHVKCIPRFGGAPVVIPLLEGESPAS